MNSSNVNLSPWEQITDQLSGVWETLRSDEILSSLSRISPHDGAELRRAILRVIGWFDDSISNPHLGSIFDRTREDPLNDMLKNIAHAYGVEATFAGTTGTTGLNAPAVMTLAGEGQKIGIARDCHVSVIGGLYLSGAEPIYIVPPFDPDRGVLVPPSPSEVTRFLDKHPDVVAIVLTMPTYHGLMGDIAAIVEECHQRNVRVMVDGAHGPHFHFLRESGFPMPAEDAGADLVTQSTHKVLSALNQGSLLHFNNTELIPRYEEFQSMGFQSTSFSYPILLSIEHAIQQMVTEGPAMWLTAVKRAARFRDGASRIHGVQVLDEEVIDGERVLGLDPTRVTINVRGSGYTGYHVADELLARELIVEMATPDVVLFFVSPSVTSGMVEDTLQAMEEVLRARRDNIAEVFEPPILPERVLTPRRAAMLTDRERIPTDEAAGRISAETIGCYPPGQAIFVAGERITLEGIDYLQRAVDAGGHLKRIQDDHFQTIAVVRETN